jgi:ATP-dependent DNA helicase RecG
LSAPATTPTVLETDIEQLPGVGPRRAEPLRKVGVATFGDLLRYYPRRYLDRSTVTRIRDLHAASGPVTIVGTVVAHQFVTGPRGRGRFEMRLQDASGGIVKAVWFRGGQWIGRAFGMGARVALHGKPELFGRTYSLAHPDFHLLDEATANLETARIVALYPGGQALEKVGLNSRSIRRLVHGLIRDHGHSIPEVLPAAVRAQAELIDGNVAIRAIHFPKNRAELDRAQRRLKYEEFFFLQLLLAMTKGRRKRAEGPALAGRGALTEAFLSDVLPFALTGAQERVIEAVVRDTASGSQMNRLVQGDVGSGKTVVGVAAMLMAVDAGYQAAFLAPTEILAEQHFANLRSYLQPLGVDIRLVIGGQRKGLRASILEELAEGRLPVAVGTHALLEETVRFRNLGLAVIDEQHRFGVMQRAQMFRKGRRPHVLMMSATPIPRSLAMTVYGDLDVTVMDEMPGGRRPIETRLYSELRREEMYVFLKHRLREGRQAYVVYPLVEESEKLDLKDAETGFISLRDLFKPYSVDLVHGRLLPHEKDEAMERFKSGETDILVATTVIEVGVDVPNATVMVVEHAERFGLSQLHQLRGRVGRGAEQSYCFLMPDFKRTAEAEERLQAIATTQDGFEIAELDLRMRGAGDFFGTRQSGLPELKLADIVRDAELLQEAREAAFGLVDADPKLEDPANATMREYFARTAPRSLGFARVG